MLYSNWEVGECMLKFPGGGGGAGVVTPSKPLLPTNSVCLYSPSVFKMFLERSLNDPPPPYFKHLSLLPPPHPPPLPPPKKFWSYTGQCLLGLIAVLSSAAHNQIFLVSHGQIQLHNCLNFTENSQKICEIFMLCFSILTKMGFQRYFISFPKLFRQLMVLHNKALILTNW